MLKIKDNTSRRKFAGRQDINFWDNQIIKELVDMYKFKWINELIIIDEIVDNYNRKAKYLKDIDLGKFAHELDIDEINDAGLTWWCCPECNGDDFEILDLYTYKCKDCNHEDKIPYRP